MRAAWKKVSNTYGFHGDSPSRQREMHAALAAELLADDESPVVAAGFCDTPEGNQP